MATLELAGHLSAAELGRRYRAERGRVARGHLQVVGLLAQGRGRGEVARIMGLSAVWVAAIVRRYNAAGPDGLGDRRRGNAGARPLLDAEGEAALRAALTAPPADGGLWTGPKVAVWMAARLGREVWPQRGWDYLRRLGHSPQVPRPRHAKAASPEEQAEYKKDCLSGTVRIRLSEALTCYDAAHQQWAARQRCFLTICRKTCHRSWPGSAPMSSAGSTCSRPAGQVDFGVPCAAMATRTR